MNEEQWTKQKIKDELPSLYDDLMTIKQELLNDPEFKQAGENMKIRDIRVLKCG